MLTIIMIIAVICFFWIVIRSSTISNKSSNSSNITSTTQDSFINITCPQCQKNLSVNKDRNSVKCNNCEYLISNGKEKLENPAQTQSDVLNYIAATPSYNHRDTVDIFHHDFSNNGTTKTNNNDIEDGEETDLYLERDDFLDGEIGERDLDSLDDWNDVYDYDDNR